MDIHAVGNFFSHLPLDWVILALFVALVAFDTMRAGPGRAVVFSLAAPLTVLFLQYLPTAQYIDGFLKGFSSSLSQAVIALTVFAALALIISRMMDSFSSDAGRLIQSLVAGVCAALVLAVVWTQLPALSALWHAGAQVQGLFGGTYRFWWLLLAYIGLGFSRI